MRREPRKRLDTQAVQTPLANLDGAFTDVSRLELPAGAPTPVPVTAAGSSPPPPAAPWKPGRVVLRRERAHRGGKTVIVIEGFATHLPAVFIGDVARKLRAACGCGGAVRGRAVEIQGDQPQKVRAYLEAEGFEVAGVR